MKILTEWTTIYTELINLVQRRKEARVEESNRRVNERRTRELFRIYHRLFFERRGQYQAIYISSKEFSNLPSAQKFLQSKTRGPDDTELTQGEQEEILKDLSDLSSERLEEMRADCARIVRDGLVMGQATVQKLAKAKGKMKQTEKEHSDEDLLKRPSALYRSSLQTFEELRRSLGERPRSSSWSKTFPEPPPHLVQCAEALSVAIFPTETITVDRVISMGCTFVCNRCPDAFKSGPKGWKDIVSCSSCILIICTLIDFAIFHM